ncbi:type I 3-dehydroquinate dehydratase [Schaalia suimastitidis]|uniref:type I 3-dehydroquinate dehydratase n=1 Tax=Schaalia suimastitidis TaxID=121163 RepID=UPI00040EFC39|nr:type I 3-dehydroquinate dehydratase [Schaalia suimastitidis]
MGAKPLIVGRGTTTVSLGDKARIIVPLTASSVPDLIAQIDAARNEPHDLFEWRVDYFHGEPSEALADIHAASTVPLIATVRTTEEGGKATLTPHAYAQLVTQLATRADVVDVEISRRSSREIIGTIHAQGAAVIASYHNFLATPPEEDLRTIITAQANAGADILKFACHTRSRHDLVTILTVQMWANDTFARPIIGIGMGPEGTLSRICGMSLGCAATFATVGAASAPGQLRATDAKAVLNLLNA